MFPWQSGSNGREESQALHLNPRSRHWSPDHTSLQRHIGIAIAHNTWRYYQSTADEAFLNDFGAELILDTTRFLAGLARYDPARDRYVVEGVVGPDEYHTAYPGAATPGINNNAYTNVMLAWLCRTASTVLDMLSAHRRRELTTELGLHSTDIDHWDRLSRKLFVPFRNGIPDQFEGYSELAELDWRGYRDHYGDIRRLDRILEAEGDDPNRYQASKQADVLMLFYLLSAEELRDVLDRLGYPFPPHRIPETIEHYLRRTSHGSTLSAVVHAWVLARANRHQAWEHFHRALDSDVHDTQGGSTSEGIHLAAMTGTIDLLQRCFAGIDARDGALHLNPCWPQELGELKLELLYRATPCPSRSPAARPWCASGSARSAPSSAALVVDGKRCCGAVRPCGSPWSTASPPAPTSATRRSRLHDQSPARPHHGDLLQIHASTARRSRMDTTPTTVLPLTTGMCRTPVSSIRRATSSVSSSSLAEVTCCDAKSAAVAWCGDACCATARVMSRSEMMPTMMLPSTTASEPTWCSVIVEAASGSESVLAQVSAPGWYASETSMNPPCPVP